MPPDRHLPPSEQRSAPTRPDRRPDARAGAQHRAVFVHGLAVQSSRALKPFKVRAAPRCVGAAPTQTACPPAPHSPHRLPRAVARPLQVHKGRRRRDLVELARGPRRAGAPDSTSRRMRRPELLLGRWAALSARSGPGGCGSRCGTPRRPAGRGAGCGGRWGLFASRTRPPHLHLGDV